MKAIKGKKTDRRDAKWIANLFRFDIVKASFIPPADIRSLRELSRYRLKLSYMRTAEKNRYQNSMTISRIRIDRVLTDPFGRSATRIMDYLLSDKPFLEEKCRSLIDHRTRASRDDVMDAIHGFHPVKWSTQRPTWISSIDPLTRSKRNFFYAAICMMQRSNGSPLSRVLRNFPHCSSFLRLVRICHL